MLPEMVDDNWDTYYNPNQITNEMKELGKESLVWFKISYEWIDDTSFDNLVKQLQHVPLHIVFPNHAVVEIRSKQELMDYYDSYSPFVKEKAQSAITSYLKLIIEQRVIMPENIKIIKDST